MFTLRCAICRRALSFFNEDGASCGLRASKECVGAVLTERRSTRVALATRRPLALGLPQAS
ncbi:hypothetical protein AKJ09_06640 [Labilithrix luteola]|uniref:Uncharacterized protein n=1 Tax=Labilithrix luteola TaxID=1391654 RepID=A0A0K1Q2V3_9BACT|nr:hypothetical protein AKJ09_06640 [Labilithrix luteola]